MAALLGSHRQTRPRGHSFPLLLPAPALWWGGLRRLFVLSSFTMGQLMPWSSRWVCWAPSMCTCASDPAQVKGREMCSEWLSRSSRRAHPTQTRALRSLHHPSCQPEYAGCGALPRESSSWLPAGDFPGSVTLIRTCPRCLLLNTGPP